MFVRKVMTLFAILAFGPSFTVGRGRECDQFSFVHHVSGPYCRLMPMCKYENMSRMSVCVSVVLWCNV